MQINSGGQLSSLGRESSATNGKTRFLTLMLGLLCIPEPISLLKIYSPSHNCILVDVWVPQLEIVANTLPRSRF